MKITNESHLDHGLTPEHVEWLQSYFADRARFCIETVELPCHLGSLSCELHGPAVGEPPVLKHEVTYRVRGDRIGSSRMCRRPPSETRLVTVVAGPHEGEFTLFTAYGGPLALREPWDETLDDAGRFESLAFWNEHALTLKEEP